MNSLTDLIKFSAAQISMNIILTPTHPLPLSDDRLHVVVPLVMSVCEVSSSQADEAVVASLSFQFGKLCSGLAGETVMSLMSHSGVKFY